MTPDDRTTLAAKARTLDTVSVCWAPSPSAALPFCGGHVTWTAAGNSWCSSCSRCNATGVAASGEKADIVRLFGRSAAECQGMEP